jgi:hypothetical protein
MGDGKAGKEMESCSFTDQDFPRSFLITVSRKNTLLNSSWLQHSIKCSANYRLEFSQAHWTRMEGYCVHFQKRTGQQTQHAQCWCIWTIPKSVIANETGLTAFDEQNSHNPQLTAEQSEKLFAVDV